jgi:hypothetical protein
MFKLQLWLRFHVLPTHSHNKEQDVQLGDHELASGDWREGEVLFPL